jgi:hypothetical protein
MKQRYSALKVSRVVALLAVIVLSAASTQAGVWSWAAKFNHGGTSVAAMYGKPVTPPRTTPTFPPAPVRPQTVPSLSNGATFTFFKASSSVFWSFASSW